MLQFEVSRCHLLVDLDLPVTSPLEPRYAQDTSNWKIAAKYPFLDPARWVSVALIIQQSINNKLLYSTTQISQVIESILCSMVVMATYNLC